MLFKEIIEMLRLQRLISKVRRYTLKGLNPEQIAKKTKQPVETVNSLIDICNVACLKL